MGRLKKLKKIRIHREGTHILWGGIIFLLLINAALYWGIDCKIPFYLVDRKSTRLNSSHT